MHTITRTSMSIGTPCACMPVGCWYPLASRFCNNLDEKLYLSRSSSKLSTGSGTPFPFAITRCLGMLVDGLAFSSALAPCESTSVPSSSNRGFLLLDCAPPPSLRLVEHETSSAYLKKSSSVGSPLSAVGLATPLPFSRLLGFWQVATQRENYQTCCSAVTYTKQLDIILKPPFVEKSSSAGEQVECFHGIQWFASNTIFRYLSCTAIAEAV